MAVKTGDVNGNAKVNEFDDVEIRSNESLDFVMEFDSDLVAGTEIVIPVKANNFEEIIGFQYSLNFDPASVRFVGYQSAALQMEDGNFGLNSAEEGLITMSWNDSDAKTADADNELFGLVFELKDTKDLSEVFQMNSSHTGAEAYKSDYEVIHTSLKFRNLNTGELLDHFELMQNNPNPFAEFTVIGFNLPLAGKATMLIYDVTGKVLNKVEGDYQKGYNEITLNKSDLGATGVMYYTLQMDGYTATKK